MGHKTLAEVYEKEEKYSVAVDEYIRATEINNKDIKINYNIARLLNKDERADEAITVSSSYIFGLLLLFLPIILQIIYRYI